MQLQDFGMTPKEWGEMTMHQRLFLEEAWWEHQRRRKEEREKQQ